MALRISSLLSLILWIGVFLIIGIKSAQPTLPAASEIGIHGDWGLGDTIQVEAGCYAIEVSGRGHIVSPPWDHPYQILFWVDSKVIGVSEFLPQGIFNGVMPFWVGEFETIEYQVTFSVAWSLADISSWVGVSELGVVESDQCANG